MQGGPLQAGRVVTLDQGAVLTVDLQGGGRLVARHAAALEVGELRDNQLIVWSGSLWVQLSATGGERREPLRVATPDVSVVASRSAQLWVSTRRALEGGGTYLALLSGSAELSTGQRMKDGRLVSMPMVAGQSVVVLHGLIPAFEPGPGTVEQAHEIGASFLEPARGAVRRDNSPSTEALTQVLDDLRTHDETGDVLAQRQRKAKAAGDRQTVAQAQRDIVAHAQSLYRLRALALVRWELLRARIRSSGAATSGAALTDAMRRLTRP